MDKKHVAEILNEIGIFLELKGENQFKVRAYLNGARAVEMLEGDISQLVDTDGGIQQVKGIGSALAEKITTLVTTGDLPYYRELKQSVPQGLLEMLRIPGLGPKKISALHDTLGIASVSELEYACRENRLLDLKGFGQKTQVSILKGIEYIKKFRGNFLYGDVIGQAERLVEALKICPEVLDVQVCGSLRRCKEIVKDIDVVASSVQAEKVMKFFSNLQSVAEVKAYGKTKTSVTLENGIQADLRVVLPETFPCTVHHFTGSREHNTAMRGRAKTRGIKREQF